MQWSNNLPPANKDYLMYIYYNISGRDFSDLTGREIENIFYNEVILKWYVDKFGKIEFDYIEEEIENIYLKEHSKEEPKQETTLEDIKLEVVLESSHCQFSVVENKLATIYRNQEKILTAIKLLNNGK